jgi:chromosomal replication initiation ATPase DnaA
VRADPVSTVLHATAERFGVTVEQITGSRRFARYTIARHDAWYRLHDLYGLSLREISERFGVDHASVLYGVRRARAWHAGVGASS